MSPPNVIEPVISTSLGTLLLLLPVVWFMKKVGWLLFGALVRFEAMIQSKALAQRLKARNARNGESPLALMLLALVEE
jgi:hypothetical protein